MTRTKHTWNVKLQGEDGNVIDRKVEAFWDPEHVLTESSVGDAARTAAQRANGKTYYALKIELAA